MLHLRRHALLAPVLLVLAALPLARPQRSLAQETRGTVALLAPRTVVLVRHAEKSTATDARDPELSPAGEQRARDLARMLEHAGVTRLVASEFARTQATLVPLAAELGLEIEKRPAAEVEALAAELLRSEPGSVTVVAGHSNTIPSLAARLGVALSGVEDTAQGPQLGDAEYDRLFVVTLPPDGAPVAPSLLELRYGK